MAFAECLSILYLKNKQVCLLWCGVLLLRLSLVTNWKGVKRNFYYHPPSYSPTRNKLIYVYINTLCINRFRYYIYYSQNELLRSIQCGVVLIRTDEDHTQPINKRIPCKRGCRKSLEFEGLSGLVVYLSQHCVVGQWALSCVVVGADTKQE